MGKASRRKRERFQAVSDPAAKTDDRSTARGAMPGHKLLKISAILAGMFALSLSTWLHFGSEEGRSNSNPTIPDTVLPDPDTSEMTVPVERAIRDARQAALARPESAAVVGRLCQVLHAHWLYEEASDCYKVAHNLAPKEFRWVYLLAGVEEIRGADGERVDQLFRESIRLAPRFPPVYVRHADALLRFGRWSEARDAYAVAVELDPELVLAQRGLGQADILLGDGPAAVEHLERAASLSPGDRIVQIALTRA
jgi:tetratricopeptide (TPR) repeat protein